MPDVTGLNAPARRPDTPPAPPRPEPVTDACACGHPKEAHEHYRPGSDCGACGAATCEEFRPEGGGVRRTLRRWGFVG